MTTGWHRDENDPEDIKLVMAKRRNGGKMKWMESLIKPVMSRVNESNVDALK